MNKAGYNVCSHDILGSLGRWSGVVWRGVARSKRVGMYKADAFLGEAVMEVGLTLVFATSNLR